MAIDTVARTLWGEARNQGEKGMQAVCNVIMNRAHNPRWWGHDPISVCKMPYQFSCWLADDPNRNKLMVVTTADPFFKQAMAIATQAISGELEDATENADSYYATYLAPPTWAAKAVHTVTILQQMFFRTELSAPV